jgi:hypothetical protein
LTLWRRYFWNTSGIDNLYLGSTWNLWTQCCVNVITLIVGNWVLISGNCIKTCMHSTKPQCIHFDLWAEWFCLVFIQLWKFLLFLQDVMHTICSPHGRVEKIVIFKKQAVQSMVQYPWCKSYWKFSIHSYIC